MIKEIYYVIEKWTGFHYEYFQQYTNYVDYNQKRKPEFTKEIMNAYRYPTHESAMSMKGTDDAFNSCRVIPIQITISKVEITEVE